MQECYRERRLKYPCSLLRSSVLFIGAGKSTLLNVLTGAVAPTEGIVYVKGKDINSSMQKIRQDLGVCLQQSIFFPSLTVREHIQLFCRIKGIYAKLSRKEAEAMVNQALREVALADKSNCFAKNLSGGMQRKLSVAIAFCGGSPMVILVRNLMKAAHLFF